MLYISYKGIIYRTSESIYIYTPNYKNFLYGNFQFEYGEKRISYYYICLHGLGGWIWSHNSL